MSIEDIITLDDGSEYFVLDITSYEDNKYVYCVEIDKEEKPTDNYKFFKLMMENGEEFMEDVVDEEIIKKILPIFTANYLNDKNDEQDV